MLGWGLRVTSFRMPIVIVSDFKYKIKKNIFKNKRNSIAWNRVFLKQIPFDQSYNYAFLQLEYRSSINHHHPLTIKIQQFRRTYEKLRDLLHPAPKLRPVYLQSYWITSPKRRLPCNYNIIPLLVRSLSTWSLIDLTS